MLYLSKSKYCGLWQCPKIAWLKKYKPEKLAFDESTLSRMEAGNEVGDLAMGLFGDFVEVKNSTIGDKTSIAHLTYLGDSDVGEECNFGCGVVTANYNGKKKFRTKIGDRAFIGCNTNLIPPVQVGDGAYTAAGTTIDRDVPDGAMAIGRVRQEIKEGWADSRIRFKGGSHKTDADK